MGLIGRGRVVKVRFLGKADAICLYVSFDSNLEPCLAERQHVVRTATVLFRVRLPERGKPSEGAWPVPASLLARADEVIE